MGITLSSELNRFGFFTKRRKRRYGILHIEDLSITVVLVVHSAEVGICIKHRFLRFEAVILDKFASDANPRAVSKRTDLCLWIYHKLLARGLYLSGLYVKLAFELINRSEGANTRLVALYCCQIIN